MGIPPSKMWAEYSEDDIDMLVAVRAYEADVDPQTGMLLSEATNPGADPTDYDTPYRYGVKGHITNWARKAQLDRMDELRKELGEKANLNGIIIPVEKLEY